MMILYYALLFFSAIIMLMMTVMFIQGVDREKRNQRTVYISKPDYMCDPYCSDYYRNYKRMIKKVY